MFTPPNMSHVMCQVSPVTCHLSPVTCHLSHVKKTLFHIKKKKKYSVTKVGQSGGASRWRVCYQRGLPRLVFDKTELFPRPDTLCYTVELAHCNVPYFYIYHCLPPPARLCALCSSGPCPSGRKLQALQCIAESHTF